jgi:hypothetical protein
VRNIVDALNVVAVRLANRCISRNMVRTAKSHNSFVEVSNFMGGSWVGEALNRPLTNLRGGVDTMLIVSVWLAQKVQGLQVHSLAESSLDGKS